jgi:glycosyltransferase involved in cell wall biosynthesis
MVFKYPLYEKGSYLQEFVDSMVCRCERVVLIAALYPDKNFFSPRNLSIKWIPLFPVPIIGEIFYNLLIFFKGIIYLRDVDVINVISARPAIVGFLLGKILNKPVVCTVEIINEPGNRWFQKESVINAIQKLIYSLKYDKIICWSKYYFYAYLKKWGVGEGTVVIIPSGIDISRYNPLICGEGIRNNFPPGSFLIVFAKPMYEYNRKMAELLLLSVKLLDRDLDIRVLLGDGQQRKMIEDKIKILGLGEKISFMPIVPITKIPEYLAAADIIVLPFTYQPTTSRSLLESMAMGKAIVVTNSGEITEMLTDGEEALVVEPEEKALASAIRRVCFDRELKNKLGRNARLLVEKSFSIESVADKTLEVYREVICPLVFVERSCNV